MTQGTWLRSKWKPLCDALLLGLPIAVAFLLACYKETDNDIWWHLAGGEWILRERRVPDRDPFTFASADRPWIDLHWLFEVAAALAYRAAAMPGVVLLAASLSAATMAALVTMHKREWPVPLVIACWAPALMLMGWRLPPRPELCTLLFLASFLAVLHRLDEWPKLAWILPAIQVLWVNTHGLFVLGPVVLAFDIVAKAVERWRGLRTGEPVVPGTTLRTLLPAAVAVVAACLVNPYFVRGALFPLELFPKISSSANVYKQSIGEFASLSSWAQSPDVPGAGSAYFCVTYFLLLLAPASFLLPAVWKASTLQAPAGRRAGKSGEQPIDNRWWWWFALACAVGLAVASTLSLPGRPNLRWWALGRYAPAAWLVLGAVGAWGLRANGRAAKTALAGATAMAAWTVSLRAILFGHDDLLGVSGHAVWLVAAAAVTTAALVLRQGTRLDRLLFAGAFGYLAMQAMRNGPLFGLVAGAVLACNLGEWTADLNRGRPHNRLGAWTGGLMKLATAAVIGLWIFAIVSNGYHAWTRQRREFGLQEAPFVSAHGAARFAGQAGLPTRAVCFNLGQAGVYSFHNGPEQKPFIDARLELPSEADFRRYLALESELNRNGPDWPKMLAELGDPLVLALHLSDAAAEASLLSHADWRCIYFDDVAGVFVSRRWPDPEEKYPAVDFAERHFSKRKPTSRPEPRANFQESLALHRIDRALGDGSVLERLPLSLSALKAASLAVSDEPDSSAAWRLLAECYASLAWQRSTDAATDDFWSPPRHLAWAQAAYCARRALASPPRDPDALSTLYSVYSATGLADAQLAVGLSLLHDPSTTAGRREEINRLKQTVEQAIVQNGSLPSVGGADSIGACLRLGLPMLAAREYAGLSPADRNSLAWDGALASASASLRLGQPAEARASLEAATNVPSESVRLCRIAETHLVEQQFARAEQLLQQALAADPRLADAWWDLASMHAQQGDAAATYESCRRGLECDLTPEARADLTGLKEIADRYRPVMPPNIEQKGTKETKERKTELSSTTVSFTFVCT
jgi:tetratricopeptide (TPR) repeat protein